MSVKRYEFEYCQSVECNHGHYVLHSDYAALLARYNALEARVKHMNVWAECDKCGCLFIPGGKGSETTCATCIKEEYNALVEAVKNTLIVYDRMSPSLKHYCAARADVDRLLAEENVNGSTKL